MNNFKKVLTATLALAVSLSLAACNSENNDKIDNNVGGITADITESIGETEAITSTKTEEKKSFEVSQEILDTMEKNKHLSGSNYFVAADGSILVMGNTSPKGYADAYAKLPDVKKVFRGPSAVFALTESGDLYHNDQVIASGISDAAYCTTNSNVKGYCLKGNDIMWITRDKTVYEYSQYSDFRNMITRETFAGETFSIEVDKHDFFVVNTKGKLFAKVTDLDQFANIDFTNFEDLALVDLAKHMGKDEVESLTVAGLKGDGSVVASGTYANEILSWGKLLDITMSDGMIVGLLPDGTLKMTGDFADKMGAAVESWTNITTVEAGYAHGNNIGYIITAMDANGAFYYASLTNENTDIDSGTATAENGAVGDRFWYKYTPDGKKFYSGNGAWEEE